MECFLVKNGGGAPLNFKVLGNPKPDNPKENTVWIDTDNEITSWIFSATEPAAPSEGMVWIPTGTASVAGFNALKKNGIQVYPLLAKQYVNGDWVSKTAKIYQSGEWKTITSNFIAYENGIFNSAFQKAATSFNTEGYLKIMANNTYTSDALFDYSPYNTIVFSQHSWGRNLTISLLDSSGNAVASISKSYTGSTQEKIVMDISAVVEKCYLQIKHTSSDANNYVRFTKIEFLS